MSIAPACLPMRDAECDHGKGGMAGTGKWLGLLSPTSPARRHWQAVLHSYAVASLSGNLAWEFAHVPLYTIWRTETPSNIAFTVVHCTAGDLVLALGTFAAALLVAGDRDWPVRNFWSVTALTVLFGVGSTLFLEWLNVVIWKSWAYSSLMPVLPVFGFDAGLSPLLQWIIVPAVAIWCAGRRGKLV